MPKIRTQGEYEIALKLAKKSFGLHDILIDDIREYERIQAEKEKVRREVQQWIMSTTK